MDAVDTSDLLRADDALVACFMREPRRTHRVADGVKSRHSRPAPFVDDDMSLVDPHSLLLEANAFDVARDADGEDGAARGDLLNVAVALAQARGHTVGITDHPLDMCFGVNDDALPR